MAPLEIPKNFKDEQIEHRTEYIISSNRDAAQDQDRKSQTFNHRDLILRFQIIGCNNKLSKINNQNCDVVIVNETIITNNLRVVLYTHSSKQDEDSSR